LRRYGVASTAARAACSVQGNSAPECSGTGDAPSD
jgi:hypothetical protein